MQIQGATALVAGGASGLGAATARRLAEAGANVTIADLNEEKGEALAQELGARFVRCDVTEPDQVEAAVPEGVRISVCCAGVGWAEKVAGRRGPHQFEPFRITVTINLIGTFNVLRLAAAAMLGNEPDDGGECGVIVNTASIAAFDGQIGQIAYAASKGGVVGMTLPAARDLASARVRVCTIAPGLFDTPLLAALPEEARAGAGRVGPPPAPPRHARGVRVAGRPHRREPDAQRRGHPARRRAPHGPALTRCLQRPLAARGRSAPVRLVVLRRRSDAVLAVVVAATPRSLRTMDVDGRWTRARSRSARSPCDASRQVHDRVHRPVACPAAPAVSLPAPRGIAAATPAARRPALGVGAPATSIVDG